MRFFFIIPFIFVSYLGAVQIDPEACSFELREKRRVDQFDFSGTFPNLENIDIDARRKKRVEVFLTGEYPALETVNYEGGFGSIIGKLTGDFPKLSVINFMCTSATLNMDLRAPWQQSCEINIRGTEATITLKLPQDVGLVVNTKISPGGHVVSGGLKKQGWGIINKSFTNALAENAPIVLHLNVEVKKGTIILE